MLGALTLTRLASASPPGTRSPANVRWVAAAVRGARPRRPAHGLSDRKGRARPV